MIPAAGKLFVLDPLKDIEREIPDVSAKLLQESEISNVSA